MSRGAPEGVSVRALMPGDWPAVREIYRAGIATGHATFERDVPSWEGWDEARRPEARLVAEARGEVVGFAALSPVSKRPVYAGWHDDRWTYRVLW